MFDVTDSPTCRVSVAELLDASAVLKLACDTKSTRPILGAVLFEGASITATDVDKRATWFMAEPVARPFAIALPALQKILKGADRGKLVSFSVADDVVTVDCDGLVSRLATFPVEEFPRDVAGRAVDDLGAVTMTQAEMHAWLAFVAPSMSCEQARYYLNSVYLHGAGGRLTAVATDGHRLSIAPRPEAWADGAGGIVPRDTVKALLSALDKKGAGPATLHMFKDASRIRTDSWELQSRNVDGSFPDYTRVIPKVSDTVLTLDVKKTTASLKRLHGLQDTRYRRVVLDAAAMQMRAESDGGSHAMALPAGRKSGDAVAGFDSAYLLDALASFPDAAALRAEISTGNPALFGDRDGACVIVMPMRRA